MREDRSIEEVAGDADVVRTLACAFQDDPALAWLLPDAERRARRLVPFFKVMQAQSQRKGEVVASPGREAASLWYPPGVVKHSALQDLRDNLAMVGVFRTALGRGLKLAEAMYAQHPNPQPYWYLRYVGVVPEAQGKGWGSAIVRAGIARAARHRCGVLLETATPSNVAIYSRLGFDITSEWDAPEGGPQFWTMVRPLEG